MKVFQAILLLLLIIPASANSAPLTILEGDSPDNAAVVRGGEDQILLEPAWQGYMGIFNPIRDAMVQRDFKALRPWVQHLKDSAATLAKSKAPDNFNKTGRRMLKEVLKRTKTFIKAIQSRERDKVVNSFDHLKDAIDRFDEFRQNL